MLRGNAARIYFIACKQTDVQRRPDLHTRDSKSAKAVCRQAYCSSNWKICGLLERSSTLHAALHDVSVWLICHLYSSGVPRLYRAAH